MFTKYISYTCIHDDSLILATYDGTIRLCRELIQIIDATSIYSNSINQTYNILNNNCKTFYCVTLCHSSCCFISFYSTILHCSNFNCVADCDSQPTNICKLVASAGFARVMNIMNPWHVSTHETKIEELIPNNKTSTWSLNDKNMRSWLIITLMLGYKSNRFQEGLIKYINISRIHLLQPFNKKGSKCRGGKRQVLKLLMGMTWKRRFHVVSLGSTSQTPAKMYPNNTLKTNICDSRGKHESISFPFGVIDILECISKKRYPNSTQTKASQNKKKHIPEALTSVYWVGSPGRLF